MRFQTRGCSGRVVIVSRTLVLLGTVAGAELLAARVRGHWHVENKLHWVLDVTFGEDHARISRKHGAESMAVMRKLAMNLLTRAPAAIEGKPESKKQKAMSASWRFSYLLSVLTGAEAEPPRKRTRAPVGARAWDKPPRST
jgi:hypothetical protein